MKKLFTIGIIIGACILVGAYHLLNCRCKNDRQAMQNQLLEHTLARLQEVDKKADWYLAQLQHKQQSLYASVPIQKIIWLVPSAEYLPSKLLAYHQH